MGVSWHGGGGCLIYIKTMYSFFRIINEDETKSITDLNSPALFLFKGVYLHSYSLISVPCLECSLPY